MSNVDKTYNTQNGSRYPGIVPGSVADASLIPPALRSKGLSRRRLLQALGAMGSAAVVAPGVLTTRNGATASLAAKTAPPRPAGLKGDLTDIKHVVIFMQENRSFDHYYGTLRGVKGYSDKQSLQYPDGTSVFQQPDASRTDGGYLQPFRMETGVYNAQNAGGLEHTWPDAHAAFNNGANNGWVAAKGEQTMGYFTADDIPWQYALASQYTICDDNHCAIMAATTPNRVYMWSGMIDPTGDNGGPDVDNGADTYDYTYTWEAYPQTLQNAGVSWQTYVNNNASPVGWLGDYGDNGTRSFAAFNTANATAAELADPDGLFARGGVLETGTSTTVADSSDDLQYVLQDFISDCAAGTLPEVSYIVAPYLWSEHPSAAPDWGAVFTDQVITALQSNDDIWNSTLLILHFDENDGYFDHVPAPVPEPGTEGEFITAASNEAGYDTAGMPIGPGARVPMILVSPWTWGGYVASEVFDHTSVIQFLEKWTTAIGKPAICPNITEWRRTVCGDLTSAIDLTSYDNSYPVLPDTATLAAAALNDANLPAVDDALPGPYLQTMPVQDTGEYGVRPVPYQQHATLAVDRSTGLVTASLTNTGAKGVSMLTFPDKYKAFAATPNTVTRDNPKSYTWDTTSTDGNYAFTVYGPDRFVRSFAGTVVNAGQSIGQVPVVNAELVPGPRKGLRITLANEGQDVVQYTLTVNDFDGKDQTVWVSQGRPVTVEWPADRNGYYDVIITADTNDGFTHRYAGRIS